MERYISFCGINGAGKSTQAGMLGERLRRERIDFATVKNPGTTPIGEAMRELVVGEKAGRPDATSAILMHTIAHRVTVMQVVEPALRSGAVVVEDRGAFCGRVYAGASKSSWNSMRKYAAMSAAMHADYVPRMADLHILLDIDVPHVMGRLEARAESERKVWVNEGGTNEKAEIRRAAYLTLANHYADKFVVLDGRTNHAVLADQVWAAVNGKRENLKFPKPLMDASWVLG